MMNRTPFRAWILLFLLTSFAGSLSAQQTYQTYRLSAQEAKNFALQHVTEIKNLKVDRQIADARNKEITGQAMPQLNGTVSLQRFFVIPTQLLPDFVTPAVYGVLESEGVQDGNGNPIMKPGGPPNYLPAQFGVPWQASVGFSFQQLLFQPDVFVGLQARDAALKYADLNVKLMEDSVKSNVLRAYYSVLIAEKRQLFLKESITRLEKLLTDQEKLYKAGFAEKLDIDKTQVNLNNLKATSSQFDNLIYIGYASLKYSMGLSQMDTLVLTDSLSTDQVKRELLSSADFRYEDRNEIQLINTATELQKLDLKRYRLQYAPTLSAYWNFSENALRKEFDFFDFSQPWFETSIVGVNMSVPIFDGFQRQNRVKQARYALEKTQNNKENLQRVIDFQREAAVNQLRNSLTTLDIQERNMALAEKVFNTTKKKYEQGLGSSFEILQADTDFQNAQSNYFQSLYDAINAKIVYYRSLGKL
jgi:outer membrane protein TolC